MSKISVLWFKNHINGLRFTDDKGKLFVNESWFNKGDWETKDVEQGGEIIGIQCNVDSLSQSMPIINFMLWCPKMAYNESMYPIPAPIIKSFKATVQ